MACRCCQRRACCVEETGRYQVAGVPDIKGASSIWRWLHHDMQGALSVVDIIKGIWIRNDFRANAISIYLGPNIVLNP